MRVLLIITLALAYLLPLLLCWLLMEQMIELQRATVVTQGTVESAVRYSVKKECRTPRMWAKR